MRRAGAVICALVALVAIGPSAAEAKKKVKPATA